MTFDIGYSTASSRGGSVRGPGEVCVQIDLFRRVDGDVQVNLFYIAIVKMIVHEYLHACRFSTLYALCSCCVQLAAIHVGAGHHTAMVKCDAVVGEPRFSEVLSMHPCEIDGAELMA